MRIRHLSPLGREAISSIISNPHLSPVGGGGGGALLGQVRNMMI